MGRASRQRQRGRYASAPLDKRDLLAARQVKNRSRGRVTLPTGAEAQWQDVLAAVTRMRVEALDWERLAVESARAVGVSWDRISVELGGVPSGEQLRRRYSV